MNSRYIKIVAIVTMTIDHIGFFLFPDSNIFRIIGRIAMPLFAFLIAYGMTKTRDIKKYFWRLFIFAIVVQVFFNLYIHNDIFYIEHWNILFTLALGVLASGLIKTAITISNDKSEMRLGRFLWIWVIIFGAITVIVSGVFFPIDYSMAGILLVVLFYLALLHSVKTLKITAVASIVMFNILLHWLYGTWLIQWWALLALPFILLFVDKKLKISKFEKYAFYVFYPLHFALLHFISGFL